MGCRWDGVWPRGLFGGICLPTGKESDVPVQGRLATTDPNREGRAFRRQLRSYCPVEGRHGKLQLVVLQVVPCPLNKVDADCSGAPRERRLRAVARVAKDFQNVLVRTDGCRVE